MSRVGNKVWVGRRVLAYSEVLVVVLSEMLVGIEVHVESPGLAGAVLA